MLSNHSDLTVRQRLNLIVKSCAFIENSTERQDSASFQERVFDVLKQLSMLQSITLSLSLFSSNEQLNEINTSYLPFAALLYYEAILYPKLFIDPKENIDSDSVDILLFKPRNLKTAKVKNLEYLTLVDSFRDILSPEQLSILNSFKKSYNPSNEDILAATGDPALRRASKIASYKLEKDLLGKVVALDEYYANFGDRDGADEDLLQKMDEDTVRSLYENQLRLFSVNAFKNLELIAMELQVLESRDSQQDIRATEDIRVQKMPLVDRFEYTSRLESDPTKQKDIADLISKLGKILQPFVITGSREKLRSSVFGTGQVLPSMSIEEYLDYELANGKMASNDAKDSQMGDSDDNTDDSDEEIRKREWDDWKDENPKGSGNMKANMG
ncbi:TAP42-like protein [Metschnikowia bicuspidata var. bicuspidata NRRL YB-4993]|uniref:TAP42-like protein n=1 Tax=Metschnikowia bicuspidata var. bicuspidata NRRL YB-4993 TaxID=869754 RepID=A0A1A0HGE8_9ASCO|nr:TAP42-like protein [Metschnikowia bicuspidata var. bicuspidata NRRL YB-4993]OBA22928.1 TAP42-like protein [Metschnikowia bicuspidata var. bicuspidata NRRL YB-4993]